MRLPRDWDRLGPVNLKLRIVHVNKARGDLRHRSCAPVNDPTPLPGRQVKADVQLLLLLSAPA